MIERIEIGNELYAIIVRASYSTKGIDFFTPADFSQQLAFMAHPRGKIIEPHIHNSLKREVFYTKEVLIIRKGKLRVDFYTDDKDYIGSQELSDGDVILLASGGHGFEVLEDLEMFEVKQGPFAGEDDKIRFKSDIKMIKIL
jgi:mannose-6-phosphate isomerase-like protein (cupin superfamily)